MADNVDYKDLIYQDAYPYLEKMLDVVGGTEKIRAKTIKYLKKYDGETATSYDNRLSTSEWNDVVNQTVEDSRDKIFRKPIQFSEDMPDEFTKVIDNADGNGQSLNEWAKHFCIDGIEEGLSYIYVDYPQVPKGLTVAQFEALAPQPTFSVVRFSDVINRIVGKKGDLVQATIVEKITVQKGRFEQEQVNQYRVLWIENNDVHMEVYVETDKGATLVEEDTIITPIKNGKKLVQLPLIPFYTAKEKNHTAKPPLNELANLAITWYNKRSQYSRALRISGDPTLKRWGMTIEEQRSNGQTVNKVGVNAVYNFNGRKDENDAEWFTPDITSLEEMRNDLLEIEKRMDRERAALQEKNQVSLTATQASIESADKTSKLANWATSLEQALNQAKTYALWLMNIDDKGEIIVNADFDEMTMDAQDAKQYLDEVTMGALSKETYQEMMVLAERRPPNFDVQKELDRLKNQEP